MNINSLKGGPVPELRLEMEDEAAATRGGGAIGIGGACSADFEPLFCILVPLS